MNLYRDEESQKKIWSQNETVLSFYGPQKFCKFFGPGDHNLGPTNFFFNFLKFFHLFYPLHSFSYDKHSVWGQIFKFDLIPMHHLKKFKNGIFCKIVFFVNRESTQVSQLIINCFNFPEMNPPQTSCNSSAFIRVLLSEYFYPSTFIRVLSVLRRMQY